LTLQATVQALRLGALQGQRSSEQGTIEKATFLPLYGITVHCRTNKSMPMDLVMSNLKQSTFSLGTHSQYFLILSSLMLRAVTSGFLSSYYRCDNIQSGRYNPHVYGKGNKNVIYRFPCVLHALPSYSVRFCAVPQLTHRGGLSSVPGQVM
jgi:hypothetical protein